MGIDVPGAKLLLAARAAGVSFASTLTVGRQRVNLRRRGLEAVLRAGGIDADAAAVLEEADGFAEPLLRALGATTVESIDASDYEQATIVHDLNTPVSSEHDARFDAVLEYGSLEHVFNFPVAMQSCMRMVCEGGHFLSVTIANNYMGHGFYQFSPELYFRIFGNENGFELVHVFLTEVSPPGGDWDDPWYEVVDPNALKRRVLLQNAAPTYMLVLARRTATKEILATPPQQSDYASDWEAGASGGAKSQTGRGALDKLLARPKREAPRLRDDPAAFRPVSFDELMGGTPR